MEIVMGVLTLATAMLVLWNAIHAARSAKLAAEAARSAKAVEGRVQQLTVNVDGRFTELLELTKRAALAEGHLAGIETAAQMAIAAIPEAAPAPPQPIEVTLVTPVPVPVEVVEAPLAQAPAPSEEDDGPRTRRPMAE